MRTIYTQQKTFSGAARKPPRFLMCINLDDFDSGYFELAQSIRKENVVTKSGSRHTGYDTKLNKW
jgi:hypothetical protein